MPMRGYTLLEMLVVILLLGLVTGLTVPRLDRMFDSMRLSYERDDVLQAIGELVFEAYRQRQGFELVSYPPGPDTLLPLELPQGWYLKAEAPIQFRANGVCSGGVVQLQHRSQTIQIRLVPPLCQPEV